ncbi:disulfide bond corrector protein DsbC [Lacibacter cauensis]|uniref:Disulfide bond corrector protein DsbC n=1 Tax=Lacibacter cauensis TaxID=510947 RepID=A0A562SX34_9BACT|nr:protein-disulfide reductase DsbD domain-containing protein [Lacibacter cauensis]TWI85847.1 disulfide bond corrector protein DsbC [Lacibacter cauensis]
MNLLRTVATFLSVLTISVTGYCQDVVKWNFTAKKIADKTYEIHLAAKLEEGWHIYSQSSPEGGPLPTKIVFSKNPLIMLQGKIREEGKMEIYHEDVFDVDVYSYNNKVDFVQLVKLKANAKTSINGSVEFMACSNGKCLTPEKVTFSLKL